MLTTIKANDQKRGELSKGMRGIIDKADADRRSLTAEERTEYDRMEAEYDKLGTENAELAADEKRRKRSEEASDEMRKSKGRQLPEETESEPTDAAKKALAAQATRRFITHGLEGMSGQERAALQVDNDSQGGTLVPDEQFANQLIKTVDNLVFIRQLATVFPLTSADAMGIPSLESDPSDADWTSELAIGLEDSAMATGKRVLKPNPLGKFIKISRTLLRKSAIPAEQLVTDRLAYKFAVSEEKGFLTGTGAGQPLGLFTASANGISAGRDVSTDNTTTALTAEGLINAKYSLKAQYMASPSTRWLFHRDVVKAIRKLKDGNGDYLWIRGLAGAPDSILEVPYLMSEYAPNTFTTGQYLGLIGDLKFYWIADALRMEMQRLNELYAGANQVGFIGRIEVDGMPVLEEAFARVTLA